MQLPNPFSTRRRGWLLLLLLAALLALLLAAWPAARCALGQCDDRALWCNGDCSQSCAASTGLGIVASCGDYNAVGGYCPENFQPDVVIARCESGTNCNVTRVSAYSSRLSTSSGRSYWTAGGCVADSAARRSQGNGNGNGCRLDDGENRGRVDCCLGAGGGPPPPGGGGPACTPEYAAPTLALAGYTPAYPLVLTQDPDRLGVNVAILATGGAVTNGCPDGSQQGAISALTLDGVTLADASVRWIERYLARRYPGAAVQGRYPFLPDVLTSGLGGSAANLTFHLDPLDPGFYEIHVTAIQSDGQTASAVLNIPAFLLDATLSLPGVVQP